jgi:two-component system nitrate/nitrite response regulator NarL
MAKKIWVAILEDHQSVIDGYLYRLSKAPQVEVAVIATTAEEFEAQLAEHPVDVLLLDVNVPVAADDHSPFPILHSIPKWLQAHPHLAVLVISVHKSGAIIRSVMEAGAGGYICKDDNAVIQELGSVIQIIAGGGMYLSEQARKYLLSHQNGERALSARQLEALTLCAAYPDLTTGVLAAKMDIAHSTFRNLLSEAYLKLEVHSRAAAIAKARQLGLIPPQTSGDERS